RELRPASTDAEQAANKIARCIISASIRLFGRDPEANGRRLPHHLLAQRQHAARFRTLSVRASRKPLAAADPIDLALHRDALIAARKVGDGQRGEWTVTPKFS